VKNKIYILFVVTFLSFVAPLKSFGIEALGGEITWKCAGGSNFIFELVLYRDCNSTDLTSLSENIRVWNHGTITDIAVNFISKTNISPICTPNTSSPPALSCGSGDNGGNGLGAVEKFIFQSNPINLSGVPGANGWIFTYETSARKASISNISNPASNGMTLVAKMFEIAEVQNACLDNSPVFLENPYLIVCSGTPYRYMPNISDPDLDSLNFSLVNPLNNFPGGSFNPPTNPIPTAFIAGYSALSPTPNSTMNGANVNFAIDPVFGDISFSTISSGEYVFKILVASYRNGRKIAEVEREMLVFVTNCANSNNAPLINAPVELVSTFAGSFQAGNLVVFTPTSSDIEVLQDDVTPQQNTSTISSIVLPLPQSSNGIQGSSNTINWQTNCTDLKNTFGNEYASVTYNFVVKVTDNYCQIPKVSYQRIQIELNSDVQINPAKIQCIQTLANGDLIINWDQVFDVNGDFVSYDLYSIQSGLIASVNSINTTTFTVPAVNADHDFFIKTLSGTPCTIAVSSDTVSNMFLTLFNPLDGTATLSWNPPFSSEVTTFANQYEIFREFPLGTWTSIGFVPYGTNNFIDTIDICQANLNYYVQLNDQVCPHISSIDGDMLEDRISPFAPEITSVSIDTITGLATLNWLVPNNTDIEGYVIYLNNVEFDTVFGINSTSYTYPVGNINSSLNFSVAAFDFCTSQFNPLFNQTSGRSEPHTSMFLTHDYDVCSKTVQLSWTKYLGWQAVDSIEIFGQKENGLWESYGKIDQGVGIPRNFEIILDEFVNYTFVVQALDSAGNNMSFSNLIQFFTQSTSKPSFNYLRVASVSGELVEIKHEVELISGVSELALEKLNEDGVFEEIQRIPAVANAYFTDEDVSVDEKSYSYQVRVIDSCGNLGGASNVAKTILLKYQTDNLNLINTLTWSKYEGFNGSILYYNVYRGVDGVFDPGVFVTVPADQNFYVDMVKSGLEFSGKICYYVQAVEAINIYGYREVSYSNTVCPVFEPLIYVPNSFTPNDDDLNEVFIPKFDMIDVNEYQFTIFDRWGQVIFQTKESSEGWDGKIDLSGKIAPNGSYMYVVQIRDGNQQEIIKRGHVNVIR
jgi:gliding motility-associated-like protein